VKASKSSISSRRSVHSILSATQLSHACDSIESPWKSSIPATTYENGRFDADKLTLMRFQREPRCVKLPAPAPRGDNPLSPTSVEKHSAKRARKAYFYGSEVNTPLPPLTGGPKNGNLISQRPVNRALSTSRAALFSRSLQCSRAATSLKGCLCTLSSLRLSKPRGPAGPRPAIHRVDL